MLKITKELKMTSNLEEVLDWAANVANDNPHIIFKIAKIAMIPQGYEGWGETWQVLCPITQDENGKIIWTDELMEWVDQINIPGLALHPKEDLID